MKNGVLNFSHKLSDKAREQLHDEIGDFIEVCVPCHLDMAPSADLRGQLDALLSKAHVMARGATPNFIIPPAMSYAAAYVTARLSWAPRDPDEVESPRIIWLAREGTPSQFVLGGII